MGSINEMAVMDSTGDTKVIWDTDSKDEVDAARAMFDQLIKKGYQAFSVKGKSGERDERIKKFDPALGMIIMVPQIVGG